RAVLGPLEVKTVLNDVAAVKGGAGGIITTGVHGQTAGNFGQGVKAPLNLFAIQDVSLTHLVRRVGQTGFIKQSAVVEHRGREDGKRQADQLALVLVELQEGRVNVAGVVVKL